MSKYTLPEHTIGSLYRYFVNGYQPGGFLTAVINEEFSAYLRADKENLAAYGDICMFVYILKSRATIDIRAEYNQYANSLTHAEFEDVCIDDLEQSFDLSQF